MSDDVRVPAARLFELERLASLGRASAGHAHELKNALMVLQGFAQLARKAAGGGDPRLSQYVREIEGQADRLVAELRAYLALTRGEEPDDVEKRPLGAVIDEVSRLVKPIARQRELLLEVSRPAALERPVRDPPMRAAILNLLLNAVDFAKTKVVLEARVVPDGVEVVVRDDGPGLDPAVREGLFEPLRSGRPNGFGLGLAQAKAAVEAEGGRIAAAASASGASFVLVLP